jgi:hypothetical protein
MGDVPVVAQIIEHEDEPQMFQEETVTKTQFYEMEGILHKQTGEILTFVEAIRQGLLDLSQGGEFFDIGTFLFYLYYCPSNLTVKSIYLIRYQI